MPDRLESWKHGAPGSAKEEVVADLLKQVGDAETLSPQALDRIARRLHSAGPRPFWFGNLGLVTATVGGLAVVLIAVMTVRLAGNRGRPSTSGMPEDRTLARNDVMPASPPEAEKSEPISSPSEQHRPATLAAKNLVAPASVPAHPVTRAKKSVAENLSGASVSALGKTEFVASPFPAGAARSLAAGAPAASDRAEAVPSSAPSCRAAVPRFSATLAHNTGDVEQALIGRASCSLLLGEREAGLTDLRDYLTRFPQGRYAARARAMLNGVDAR